MRQLLERHLVISDTKAYTLADMRAMARNSGNDTFSLPSVRDILTIKFREVDRGMVYFLGVFFCKGKRWVRLLNVNLSYQNNWHVWDLDENVCNKVLFRNAFGKNNILLNLSTIQCQILSEWRVPGVNSQIVTKSKHKFFFLAEIATNIYWIVNHCLVLVTLVIKIRSFGLIIIFLHRLLKSCRSVSSQLRSVIP